MRDVDDVVIFVMWKPWTLRFIVLDDIISNNDVNRPSLDVHIKLWTNDDDLRLRLVIPSRFMFIWYEDGND